MEFLKIENLCKVYGKGNNQVTALDHVSLTIEKEDSPQSSVRPARANLHCFTASGA